MNKISFLWFNDTNKRQNMFQSSLEENNKVGTIEPQSYKTFDLKLDGKNTVMIKTWASGTVLVTPMESLPED